MYRIKIRNFCLIQPLLLAGIIDFELSICNWAAEHRPESTAHVYTTMVEWFRVVAGGFHPFNVINNGRTQKMDPLQACKQVHLFCIFFVGYIFPSMVIWRLEKQVWRSFLASDAEEVAWPGGPSIEAIAQGLHELRVEEQRKVRTEKAGVRLVAVVIIASVFLWITLDMLVTSYGPLV